jgi:hypothetical protein
MLEDSEWKSISTVLEQRKIYRQYAQDLGALTMGGGYPTGRGNSDTMMRKTDNELIRAVKENPSQNTY